MRQVGDYQWDQLSMWDFAPDDCVETFVKSDEHTFHFVLKRITGIVTDHHWRTEVVKSTEGVPADVLGYRNGNVRVRANGKSEPVEAQS